MNCSLSDSQPGSCQTIEHGLCMPIRSASRGSWSRASRLREVSLLLSRLHPEYCIQFWAPQYVSVKDFIKLERACLPLHQPGLGAEAYVLGEVYLAQRSLRVGRWTSQQPVGTYKERWSRASRNGGWREDK